MGAMSGTAIRCTVGEEREGRRMTKEKARADLMTGKTMDALFHFVRGDGCLIFKADTFQSGDEIIYIPDIALNELVTDRPVADDGELEEIMSCCYTGDDFLGLCGGDWERAERLFWICRWEHPGSVVDEVYALCEENG